MKSLAVSPVSVAQSTVRRGEKHQINDQLEAETLHALEVSAAISCSSAV